MFIFSFFQISDHNKAQNEFIPLESAASSLGNINVRIFSHEHQVTSFAENATPVKTNETNSCDLKKDLTLKSKPPVTSTLNSIPCKGNSKQHRNVSYIDRCGKNDIQKPILKLSFNNEQKINLNVSSANCNQKSLVIYQNNKNKYMPKIVKKEMANNNLKLTKEVLTSCSTIFSNKYHSSFLLKSQKVDKSVRSVLKNTFALNKIIPLFTPGIVRRMIPF